MAVGGIVAGVFGVGAIVLIGDALLFEVLLDKLLEGECSVVWVKA